MDMWHFALEVGVSSRNVITHFPGFFSVRVDTYCLHFQCTKKHSLVCADFEKTGSCPRGSACKMQHPRRVTRDSAVGRRKRKLEAATGPGNEMTDLR